MAPSLKQKDLLLQIVQGQATLAEKVDIMNTRLFGGPGQDGTIPVLFRKHDEAIKEIQEAKDKVTIAVDGLKDHEIKEHSVEIAELKTRTGIVLWRTGLISSVAGSGLGIGVTMLVKKVFHL